MTHNKEAIVIFLILLLLPVYLGADELLVIRAKKIYTVSSGLLENGRIFVSNGKILRVGKNLAVPDGARVIEADTVIPGLIDIHSHLGVYSVPGVKENEDGNEMTTPVTPQVRALDSFNFEDPALKIGLAGGVTTIVSRPGSGNVIGGTSIAVKLKNAPPEQMILKEICDLKMTIEGNPVAFHGRYGRMPTSMMGVYYLARQAFVEAQAYQKDWKKYFLDKEAGKDVIPPLKDIGKDALVMALKGEIPIHIHVNTAAEIMSCIRLADEFGLKLTLAHCTWAYLITEELAKRKDVHFNVGPAMFLSYFDNMLQFKNCPAILANAGLNVSLQIDAVSGRQPGQQHLLHTAALCVRYGMKKDDALKAITIRGAQAVLLDKRIGSIEKGKDADMVFLDGDPFEILTSVKKVMIDGKIEYHDISRGNKPFQSAIPMAEADLTLPSGISDIGKYAIRAGMIFTMAGPRIQNGIIVVNNGRIAAVGKNVPVPVGIPVIDAQDFVAMPGLISARSQIGISYTPNNQSSTDEITMPVVPELEAKHAVDPQEPLFSASRRLGVTAVMITPGNRNVIGGRGLVVKTAGNVVDKMVVRDNAVMVFGLGTAAKRINQMPSTRMGMAAMLRQKLLRAKNYNDQIELHKRAKSKPPPRDLSLEAMLPLLRGEMPAMVHCERLDDILTAIRIADEFHLQIILTGAVDAYKAVEEIKKRDIPVVLESIFRGAGNLEDKDFIYKNAAVLSRNGIKVNFTLSDYLIWYIPLGLMGADPLEIAAYVYKNGMSEEAALRSITIDAARIIGCESRIGSLEKGKDADILILRGHPFYTKSVPEAVFINGDLVYQRKKGEHLSR